MEKEDLQEFTHPYIPNTAPEVKARMMQEIGINSLDELYDDIPKSLRFKGEMNMPRPFASEMELKRHVEKILSKNTSCKEAVCFLGGGSAYHYVPAGCDEITHRSEFLTAYAGEPYEDAGRFQTLFEYQSLMAELLDFDVVNVPTYDWGQAASTSLRMSARITKRKKILVSDTISPARLAIVKNYCEPVLSIQTVKHVSTTGQVDMDDLRSKAGPDVAALYFENPSYLGFFHANARELSDTIHQHGGISVVGVDPVSLGVITPPSQYGADIACGDIQSLGNHMYFGGTLAGFIATRDEERFVMEYPSRLFGISTTSHEGEWGFGDVAYNRTSFGVREKGKEFIGTAAALYGISAAVYLSLMGPYGMRDLGQLILQQSQYAMKKLAEIPSVSIRFAAPHFKEFVVDFSQCSLSVAAINAKLLKKGIFGGLDLSEHFSLLKNCALYCVTESISKNDIDDLAATLRDIVTGGEA